MRSFVTYYITTGYRRVLATIGGIGVSVFCATVSGQDLRSTEFMAGTRVAFNEIYDLEYERAEKHLRELAQRYPDHPAPPLYLATVIWLEELFQREDLDLDRFVAPGYFKKKTSRKMSPDRRSEFISLIDKSRKRCEQILKEDPGNKDARYFLGAVHGILGSFAITIDRSTSKAFSNGKKAYKTHRRLVTEDPEYFDAYMTVGMYEYIVGSLPWYLKLPAAVVGFRGNKARGFEYLGLAAEKGEYVRNDATTLRMVLLVRDERFEEALEIVKAMRSQHPSNYLLHINEAQILEKMGNHEEAVRTYLEVLAEATDGAKNYQKITLPQFRFKVARKFEKLNRLDDALTQYSEVLTDSASPVQEKVLSHLRSGQILDLKQRHPEAVPHYRAVLAEPALGNSHRLARKYLNRNDAGE